MNRYKSLYKENLANISPRDHKTSNRTWLNASRVQKRNELVMMGRNISLSPLEAKQIPLKNITNGDKLINENVNANTESTAVKCDVTANQNIEKKIDAANKPSRKELYLKRFIEWKYNKRNGASTKQSLRPFIPSGSTSSKNAFANGVSDSKSIQTKASVDASISPTFTNGRDKQSERGRESIYVPKDTPTKKKKPEQSMLRTVLSAKNVLVPCSMPKPLDENAQQRKLPCVTINSQGIKKNSKGEKLVQSILEPVVCVKHENIIAKPVEEKKSKTTMLRVNVQPKLKRAEQINTNCVLKAPKSNKIEETSNKNVINSFENAQQEGASCTATTSLGNKKISKVLTTKSAIREPNAKKNVIKPVDPKKQTIATSRENLLPKFSKGKPTKPSRAVDPLKLRKTEESNKKKETHPAVKPKTLNKITMKPPVFSKQQPLTSKSKSTIPPTNNPNRHGGAIAKFKNLQQKRANAAGNSLKAQANSVVKKVPLDLKLIGTNATNSPPPIETPICSLATTSGNQFHAFVTSTHVKHAAGAVSNTSQEFSEITSEISPVETLSSIELPQKRTISLNTSAKRALLLPDDELSSIMNKVDDNGKADIGCLSPKNNKDLQTESLPTTPLLKDEEPPLLYLSPFVSVSRGKVNRRTEESKRASVYLASASEETPKRDSNCVDEHTLLAKPQTPSEVRRTLEAVRYFRKQLDNEIIRLHGICDKWDAYKSENLSRLEETNGMDMIDVAIGQTKLLTSKKFMQFRGLIDRCEANARGHGAPSDGSEDTKPINALDLEGFWAMVWLQVENLDKRFENLERWKDNNWSDPDEVKQAPIKKNLSKVKKVKRPTLTNNTKPNDKLRDMLLGLIKERRKMKKVQTEEIEEPVDTAPSIESVKLETSDKTSSTPDRRRSRRISVVVQDRRMYSVARTIVSVPTPPKHRLSITHKQPTDSINLELSVSERRLNDSKSVKNVKDSLRNKVLNKIMAFNQSDGRVGQMERTPSPQRIAPKSALKTPGTAKSNKNVAFNNTLSVRKFEFNDNDNEKYNDELVHNFADNGDDTDRIYCLRNRKVVLRPSTDFVIP